MADLSKHQKTLFPIVFVILIICVIMGCKPNKEKSLVELIEHLDAKGQLIIQLAELEIDSVQLETYKGMLHEGIQTSVKQEPGVLTLYAMQDINNPYKVTVVEIYASQEAYTSHIASTHFQKYKTGTINMVDSLTLTRMKPISFAAKNINPVPR